MFFLKNCQGPGPAQEFCEKLDAQKLEMKLFVFLLNSCLSILTALLRQILYCSGLLGLVHLVVLVCWLLPF